MIKKAVHCIPAIVLALAAVAAIYDSDLRVITRDGTLDEKTAKNLIEEMKRTTGVRRDIRVGEIFDFSFVRRAGDELKASGWKP